MLFSSLTFIYYFLPITLLIYYIIPNKLRNTWLLIVSLIFYFWGEPKYTLLMLISILNGWLGGILIEKSTKKAVTVSTKAIAAIPIAIQFILLAIFKYTDFVIESINTIANSKFNTLNIALPIGISFYSFQIISYLIDVYRGDEEVETNIIDFGAYVTMFTQLIAGPIVRYTSIKEEMKNRKLNINTLSDGITRFTIGLAKKVLLADNLYELIMKLETINDGNMLIYWIIAICYTMQVYLDFSGYSDMAIGLGKMLGFTFIENFNYPLESSSITEFWRRWHLSLSTWLKDYIYIPLGGSRCNTKKWIINILLTWGFSGLWHGADWNFVIWGLYFGVWLILEKLVFKQFIEKHKLIYKLITIISILVSFIIFSYSDMSILGNTLRGMVNFKHLRFSSIQKYELASHLILIIICIFASISLPKKIFKKL